MRSRHPSTNPPYGGRQRGVTLVEILVTVVVLSVGLLGVAGLHTFSLRANQDALIHAQATVLAQDIIDRMRANRQDALAGHYDIAYGSGPPTVTADLYTSDLAAWKARLVTALGSHGDGEITKTPLGGNRWLFTVKIRWQDNTVPTASEFVTRAEI